MQVDINFENARQLRHTLECVERIASKRMAATYSRLAGELGLPLTAGGLTPDSVKFHPDAAEAKRAWQAAFNEMRDYNAAFLKLHGKRERAERISKPKRDPLALDGY